MKLPVLTNKIENRILTVVSVVVTVLAMFLIYKFGILPVQKATIVILQNQIEVQNKLISELAKDPKYSIQNDFGKIKPKQGSQVIIDLNNELNVKKDTITPIVKKRGWFYKLFNH